VHVLEFSDNPVAMLRVARRGRERVGLPLKKNFQKKGKIVCQE
jgi:hypothetical protein